MRWFCFIRRGLRVHILQSIKYLFHISIFNRVNKPKDIPFKSSSDPLVKKHNIFESPRKRSINAIIKKKSSLVKSMSDMKGYTGSFCLKKQNRPEGRCQLYVEFFPYLLTASKK